MQKFRVFNHVSRVGVEWRIGDTRFQVPSMSLLMVVFLATIALAALAGRVGGPFMTSLAVIIAITGLVAFALILKTVLQMNHMGRLRETTQIRLLFGSARSPVYTNFSTPDQASGPVYRNA
ncbi:MAG: hypothetical protein ACJA07_000481 [Rhodococcus sp. (in: high G+C Gram-positive bacteria)]|jgi:hypothetical protein